MINQSVEEKLDLLEREKEVQSFYKTLVNSNNSEAICFAINSEWGSGKTFFLNLLIEMLKKDSKNVVIEFNPWRLYDKIDGIEKELQITLNKEFGKYDGNLNYWIDSLFESTSINSSGNLKDYVYSTINKIFNNNTYSYNLNRINKAIERSNRCFYIVIDDLDRLNNREIVNFLKLIRNTINFKGLKFVLAYDRENIIYALKQENYYNYNSYLDKIIFYEAELIYTDLEKVHQLFFYYIGTLNNDLVVFKRRIRHITTRKDIQLTKFIKNIRDVKKFTAIFKESYSTNFKEFELTSLYFIELLRYKYPQVAKLIYFSKELFFKSDNNSDLSLIPTKINETILSDYLKDNKDLLNIQNDMVNPIFGIIKFLFDKNNFRSTLNKYCICNDNYFDFYFTKIFPHAELSNAEFDDVLKLEVREIKEKINYWIENKSISSISNMFYKTGKLFDDINDPVIMAVRLKILFYFENLILPKSNINEKRLYIYIFSLKKQLQRVFDSDFHNYFLKVLHEGEYPYYSEIGFLCHEFSENSNKLDFEKSVIIEQICYFIQGYKIKLDSSTNIFKEDLWRLFQIISNYHFVCENHYIKNSLLTLIMGTFANIEKFAESVIVINNWTGLYCLSDITIKLLDILNFKDVLKQEIYSENKKIQEFIYVIENKKGELKNGMLNYIFQHLEIEKLSSQKFN
ncbi:MAG: hypothetical protein IM592_12630 [Bacteroidetes bacterium]|nr:hypothetical protein [Bacteroidota bacterium]